MRDSIIGTRIRQLRREKKITQKHLAHQIGVSSSYLNLIEWNKRRATADLLKKIADGLHIPVGTLTGIAEQRLHDALEEIAVAPNLRDLAMEDDRISELIARFPGWSRTIAALARAQNEAEEKLQALSDRLSNDPFLADSMHRVLTRITAIRSTIDILHEYDDIPDDQQRRFTRILHEEGNALSDIAEALALYLDTTTNETRILTPQDEVEALFEDRKNQFPEIDQKASDLITEGLTDQSGVRRKDVADRLLSAMQPTIEAVIASHTEIKTAAARTRTQTLLSHYATSALLMPMARFIEEAERTQYDIERLGEIFAVDIQAVCQRLTALPMHPDRPRFGYFQANAAGSITKIYGLEGLALPHYSSACPLWALFRAQQSPETVIRQRALFPTGARFIFIARAHHVGQGGFGQPRHYLTDMLVMSEADSALTIYRPDPSSRLEEVGPACRMCPRYACDHRVDDPLTQ